MKPVLSVIKWIFVIIGFVATYLPLIADYGGFDMWGLAWQIWAMIGFTIFWISIGIVLLQQNSRIKKLESADAQLERKKKELEVEMLNRKLNPPHV